MNISKNVCLLLLSVCMFVTGCSDVPENTQEPTSQERVTKDAGPHPEQQATEALAPEKKTQPERPTSTDRPTTPQPALELCNGLDDNFDGQIDEGSVCSKDCGFPLTLQSGTFKPTGYQSYLYLDTLNGACTDASGKKLDFSSGHGVLLLYGQRDWKYQSKKKGGEWSKISSSTSISAPFEGEVAIHIAQNTIIIINLTWERPSDGTFTIHSIQKTTQAPKLPLERCNGLDDDGRGDIDEGGVCSAGCVFPQNKKGAFTLGIDPTLGSCDENSTSKLSFRWDATTLYVDLPQGWTVSYGSNGKYLQNQTSIVLRPDTPQNNYTTPRLTIPNHKPISLFFKWDLSTQEVSITQFQRYE